MDQPPPAEGIDMQTDVVAAYADDLLGVHRELSAAYDNDNPLIQAHRLSTGSGDPLSAAFAAGHDGEANGVLTVAGQLIPKFAETVDAGRWSAERYLEADRNAQRGMPN